MLDAQQIREMGADYVAQNNLLMGGLYRLAAEFIERMDAQGTVQALQFELGTANCHLRVAQQKLERAARDDWPCRVCDGQMVEPEHRLRGYCEVCREDVEEES